MSEDVEVFEHFCTCRTPYHTREKPFDGPELIPAIRYPVQEKHLLVQAKHHIEPNNEKTGFQPMRKQKSQSSFQPFSLTAHPGVRIPRRPVFSRSGSFIPCLLKRQERSFVPA